MKETENEYAPFGDEWKAEMMKWRKPDLVSALRVQLMLAQTDNRQAIYKALQDAEAGLDVNMGYAVPDEWADYNKANARAIAAVPDMVSALQHILSLAENNKTPDPAEMAQIAAWASAAISKANP